MEIGALLDGKYLIEKVLGEGGMGAVYLAENVQIGRKVAIKVLHPDLAVDDQLVTRFRMEARAAAAIGHPGIVDVLDMGQTGDGAEFIVMERLEGETLAQRIRARGALPADEAIAIVIEALDALAAAHDKGIVHRDLKPDNLFLVEKPVRVVKILDFGISKFQDTGDMLLTRTGAVLGTPLYMSPEQARGAKEVTHLADLYSMGAILYEALSGRPPFSGTTYNEVIANVLMEPHPSLAATQPALGVELNAVVDALLAKSPGDRPQHARVAKFQLEQVLGREPSTPAARPRVPLPISPHAATTPQTDAPAGVTQQRRRRTLAWIGGGAAVVALVGALVTSTREAPPPIAAAPILDLATAPILDLAIAPSTPSLAPAIAPASPPVAAPAPKPKPSPPKAKPKSGLEIDRAFPGQ